MKTKYLVILLVLSLGFNLGVAVTFGHHCMLKKEFKGHAGEGSWQKNKARKMLGLTDEQAKLMEKDREELQSVLKPIGEDLKNKRIELYSLLEADNVDRPKVDKLVNEIAALQVKMEKTVIEHSLKIRQNLTPEQRVKFREFFRKHSGKMPRGPHGPGFMDEGKPF